MFTNSLWKEYLVKPGPIESVRLGYPQGRYHEIVKLK